MQQFRSTQYLRVRIKYILHKRGARTRRPTNEDETLPLTERLTPPNVRLHDLSTVQGHCPWKK